MIKFVKKGRPNKAEKGLLGKINNWIGGLSEEDKSKHDFIGKSFNNKTELESIWNGISSKPEPTPIADTTTQKQETMAEPQDVEIEIEEPIAPSTEPVAKQGGIPNFFSPLAEEVKQREYNKITPQQGAQDIPEPIFQGGMAEEDDNTKTSPMENGEASPEGEAPKPSEFDNVTNESVNQLEGKEKKIACEQLVNTVLDVYEMAHVFGANFAKQDENELIEMSAKGEIDPTMEIPIDEKGTTTNPIEFFQTYNAQVDEALTYDPEFGEKVKPAMRRVFEKKGWGFTDEQYLMYMFGKDAGTKAMMIWGLKKQSSMIMKTFVEMQMQKNEALASQEPTVSPDSITHPSAKQPTEESQPPQEEPPQEEPSQKEPSSASDVENEHGTEEAEVVK